MRNTENDDSMIDKTEPFLSKPIRGKYIVLTCVSIILAISILDLVGWAFGISIFKSLDNHWTPMMIDTAICFALCALSLYIIQKRITTGLISLIPKISGVLVFIVGAITCCLHIAILNNVGEKSLMEIPFLGIFLAPNNRMALLTGCNFMLMGINIFLISFQKKRLTGIAHALIIIPLLINYIIPVSYILGVNNLHTINNIPVALSTAISFCALCLGILFNVPDSWVMKVFTSRGSGGLMARRLLPLLIILPVVIAWFRIMGEQKGLFESGVGSAIVAITYTVCFIFLTWLSAKGGNRIDKKRELAEVSLRESNEYLENLFNYANAPIIVWDMSSRITRFNPAFEKLTGRKAEEVIGRSIDILFPLDSVVNSMVLINKALSGERLEIVEINIQHVDGSIRTVLWNSAPVLGEDGKTITEIIAQGQDITERKLAEEAIAASENEFRLLTESMPQIVWTTTADGQNTYFNHQWVEYTGLSLLESYGYGWNKPFHPEDQQRAWDAWQNSVQYNADYLIQCRLRRFDGVYRWWLMHGVPVVDQKGTITKWYGTCTDIDEMKNAGDAILQNEKLLRSVIENVSSGVALIDETGKFVVYNPVFLKLFGLSPVSTIKNVNDQDWSQWQVFDENKNILHVDDHPVRKAAITGKLVKNKMVAMKLPSNSDYIWMMVSAEPLQKEDGSIDKIICTYHDITERKQVEEQIKESEERHRLLSDTMLQGVVHQDSTGKIISMNPAAERILGKTREQFQGSSSVEEEHNTIREDGSLFSGNEHPAMVTLRTGKSLQNINMGVYNPILDEYRWINVDSIPLFREGEKLPYEVYTIFEDVTERKKIEEELRETEERFRTMANAIPQLAWIAHADGFIYWYNQRWYDYTGTTPDQMEGWGWQRVHDPEVLPNVLEKWTSSINTGETFDMEFPLLGADGIFRTFLTRVMPLKDSEGRVIQWFGTNTDVEEFKRSEQTLRESEERYKSLFQDNYSVMMLLNPQTGEIIDANPTACTYYGWSHAEICNLNIAEINTLTNEEITLEMQQAKEEKRNHFFFRHRLATNEIRDVEVYSGPIRFGEEILLYSLVHDITDRKQAETELQKSKDNLRAILDATKESIYVFDTNGVIVNANETAASRLNLSLKDIVGNHFGKFIPKELVPTRWEYILKVFKTGEQSKYEDQRNDYIFEHNFFPIFENGNVNYVVSFSRDITRQKQANEAILNSERKLSEIYASMSEGLAVHDLIYDQSGKVTDYKITEVNPAYAEITGIRRNEVIGRKATEVYSVEHAPYLDFYSEVESTGKSASFETYFQPMNKHFSISVFSPRKGSFVTVFKDMTDRKKAEEELEVYRKHLEELVENRTSELATAISNLEQSNKELEEFAYVASHDLQEPLRMVSSYTQLLERRYKDKLDQDANDFINYAVDGANRMQRLINDLLEYSRVSSKGREFTKIDISQVLGQVVSNLQYLIADNLALVTNEDLPVLSIDEIQITRVFQNLIENGIKYKKKTELPRIHISCKKKNHMYEFAVRDNGIGIDMQYHDRIFIIFQRLHKKADYPGTGIGLSITKRIIERHGGTIWFDSKENEGTTFYFTIPEG